MPTSAAAGGLPRDDHQPGSGPRAASSGRPVARASIGDVWLEVEPLEPGKGFEFVNKIVGGAIPREYIPAVEAGMREALESGVLAGYPLVDVQGRGSWTARSTRSTRPRWPSRSPARWRSRKRCSKAAAILLEPIMKVEVVTPDEFMGDVIGDLSSRRGHIQGMEVRAEHRSSGPRCRWPRCSATPPTFAR